jgi:hypothetical protein
MPRNGKVRLVVMLSNWEKDDQKLFSLSQSICTTISQLDLDHFIIKLHSGGGGEGETEVHVDP